MNNHLVADMKLKQHTTHLVKHHLYLGIINAYLLQLGLPIYKHLSEKLPKLSWFVVYAVVWSRVVIT